VLFEDLHVGASKLTVCVATVCNYSLGVQELLTSPNPNSPAQREAYEAYEKNRKLYNQKIREQAARCAPDT
jgi:ubiquitin-conjugating enzyme E2 I